MERTQVFGSITKVREEGDGTLYVEGVASTEQRDTQGEVVTAAAMRKALPDYMRFPALREMHQLWAAGRTIGATVDDDGVTHVAARIVDREACEKVRQKVYTGFSIGGSVPPDGRNKTDPTVIEQLVLTEISLVDRPANPAAVFQLVKIEDAVASPVEPPPPAPEPAEPVCKACGVALACPKCNTPEAAKAAAAVARHEVAGLMRELAKVQRDRDDLVAKVAAIEAALVERTAERDALAAERARWPKGALRAPVFAVEKADDMRGEPPEAEDEDEPLGSAAAAIKRLHRRGGQRLA